MSAKTKQMPPGKGIPCDYVPLHELYIAYRNAKVDTFYERELCLGFEFVEFEEDLERNLENIRALLLTGRWIDDPAILGDVSFIPKSLDFVPDGQTRLPFQNTNFQSKTIHTNSSRSWRELLTSNLDDKAVPVANFRAMSRPSIAWLVISSFWIQKVGHKLDARLSSCAHGSRLRTNKDGRFNKSAHGNFAPYATAYGRWRDDGLRVIRHELDERRGTIALTADLRNFYHCVDAAFLADSRFKNLVMQREYLWEEAHPGEKLDTISPIDWLFTKQMAESFSAWAEENRTLLPGDKPIGLPIGPGAARVVANLALMGFDQFIEHEVQPLYYGRYVDDIFLVLRDGTGMSTGKDVWNRIANLSTLAENSPCRVKREPESVGSPEQVYRLHLDYDKDESTGASRSDLRFAGKKQKIFFIEGPGGQSLLAAIEDQIRETSSEWRQLPELPEDSAKMQEDFMAANTDTTEPADSLRKADQASIRRLKLAFHLRALEAFAEDLHPKDWSAPRERLYEFTEAQLLALPGFFLHASYVPRVFGIAAQARDWKAAQKLVRRTAALFSRIVKDCGAFSNAAAIDSCRKDFGAKLFFAVCRALPWNSEESIGATHEFEKLLKLLEKEFGLPKPFATGSVSDLRNWASRLFERDLARLPFRQIFIESHHTNFQWPRASEDLVEAAGRALSVPTLQAFLRSTMFGCEKIHPQISGGQAGKSARSRGQPVPLALVFPTRPLSPAEIGMLDTSLLTAKSAVRFQRFVRALRGTHFQALDDAKRSKLNRWFGKPASTEDVIWIPDSYFTDSVRIALPCITLSDESWVASIARKKDPDRERYCRITRVLNDVIKCEKPPHYIVLPELAVKRKWFTRFASKLEKSGISLIAGVEYAHAPSENIALNEVINSVMVSLVTRYPGYRTHLVFSQNKLRPAPSERDGLKSISGKVLAAGRSQRMIIRHGEFQFAMLICSELSDIESRAKLRGKIDALFVPEWNKDTDGFSSLVEATALDLHCFVVQSNNRRFGDSRIRAPYKESWQRDVLRLKGGSLDFHASGEIDYVQLRRFQSNHHSLEKPFKPIPDGFDLHLSRFELPLSP